MKKKKHAGNFHRGLQKPSKQFEFEDFKTDSYFKLIKIRL